MRRALSLSFILVALVVLTACGSAAPVAAPKDLVPAGANFIAQIQLSRLLQDPDFAALYD
jgi:predicted small lipoprotein YifL